MVDDREIGGAYRTSSVANTLVRAIETSDLERRLKIVEADRFACDPDMGPPQIFDAKGCGLFYLCAG